MTGSLATPNLDLVEQLRRMRVIGERMNATSSHRSVGEPLIGESKQFLPRAEAATVMDPQQSMVSAALAETLKERLDQFEALERATQDKPRNEVLAAFVPLEKALQRLLQQIDAALPPG